MWYVIDKEWNIVVASGETREDARSSKRSIQFLTGRKYRVEDLSR